MKKSVSISCNYPTNCMVTITQCRTCQFVKSIDDKNSVVDCGYDDSA